MSEKRFSDSFRDDALGQRPERKSVPVGQFVFHVIRTGFFSLFPPDIGIRESLGIVPAWRSCSITILPWCAKTLTPSLALLGEVLCSLLEKSLSSFKGIFSVSSGPTELSPTQNNSVCGN